MRTQQTSDMNRLTIESAKHTCQAMVDGKTKTETLHKPCEKFSDFTNFVLVLSTKQSKINARQVSK